jgi:hypothetical protein
VIFHHNLNTIPILLSSISRLTFCHWNQDDTNAATPIPIKEYPGKKKLSGWTAVSILPLVISLPTYTSIPPPIKHTDPGTSPCLTLNCSDGIDIVSGQESLRTWESDAIDRDITIPIRMIVLFMILLVKNEIEACIMPQTVVDR